MSQILQVNAVSKSTTEPRALLSSISFSQKKGERLAIVGETGSGKSTLLKSIGGLADVTSGEILFQGEKVVGPADRLVAGHEDIKLLVQAKFPDPFSEQRCEHTGYDHDTQPPVQLSCFSVRQFRQSVLWQIG